jgi:DNA replication licensing factor MCM7
MSLDAAGRAALATRYPDYEKEEQKVLDFLQNSEDFRGERTYWTQLTEISNRQTKVLEVRLDDVLAHKNDAEFVSNIQTNTLRYISMFEAAADAIMPMAVDHTVQSGEDIFDHLAAQRMRILNGAAEQQPEGDDAEAPQLDLPKSLMRRYEVSVVPLSAELSRKIRDIRAADIGSLVKVMGMVTRATDVKPQAAVVTYTCELCGSEVYQEISGTHFMPLQKCPSQRCKDNNSAGRLQMQSRGSKFTKYQELKVQELPNQVPIGHIPRSIVIHCHGETTRTCGPGDVVTVSGIFLALKLEGFKAMKSGLQADTYIKACHVDKVKASYSATEALSASRGLVNELARDADPYNRLAASIAPEIFGHTDVKKALLLQLVGGVTKTLDDGMKIRGDLNVLLMGDPGVAKSQLLKYISSVAPRGVYTTGKGSSGVGLTASVVRDPISGYA